MLSGFNILIQRAPNSAWPPGWLISGPVPIILAIVVGVAIIMIWINARLNRIQRDLHKLGHMYYQKEQELQDDLKAGRIGDGEYRKRHEALVREMREDSRRMTDGPPR